MKLPVWISARLTGQRRLCLAHVPGQLHITWDNDNRLKIETDSWRADAGAAFWRDACGESVRAGEYSLASWEPLQAGAGFGPHKAGVVEEWSLRGCGAGYLRKNGVPYSANTTVTEYIDVLNDPNAPEQWLMVKTIVDDPTYLMQQFITSTHFKKQADATGWNPSACSAR